MNILPTDTHSNPHNNKDGQSLHLSNIRARLRESPAPAAYKTPFMCTTIHHILLDRSQLLCLNRHLGQNEKDLPVYTFE